MRAVTRAGDAARLPGDGRATPGPRRPRRGRRKAAEAEPAATDPVARVLVDLPLAHLDRPFDYLVPAKDADDAVPGARVKVRFAGQDVDGFVARRGRRDQTTPAGWRRCGGSSAPSRCCSPEVARARRGRGRAVRRQPGRRAAAGRPAPARDDRGEALTRAPRSTRRPRRDRGRLGAGTSRPRRSSTTWPTAARPGRSGRRRPAPTGRPRWPTPPRRRTPRAGARCSCVPDHRDVARVDAALTDGPGGGPPRHADRRLGPGRPLPRLPGRLARRGAGSSLGTRAAAFAPVHDLGLVAIWDDGDDLLRRAARALPARPRGAAAARRARSPARRWWAASPAPSRRSSCSAPAGPTRSPRPATCCAPGAQVSVAEAGEREHGDPDARAPALRPARAGPRPSGPVLVQTPRSGYAPSLACERCRTPARCAACSGPLAPRPRRPSRPRCRWCGTAAPDWACPSAVTAACARRCSASTPYRRGARPFLPRRSRC